MNNLWFFILSDECKRELRHFKLIKEYTSINLLMFKNASMIKVQQCRIIWVRIQIASYIESIQKMHSKLNELGASPSLLFTVLQYLPFLHISHLIDILCNQLILFFN